MWGWGRPKRDLPEINYNEDSSEEDLELPDNAFDSPLQSPVRPVNTRAGSPVELSVPTLNDNVDEDLNQVQQTLRNLGHTPLFRKGQPEDNAEDTIAGNIIGQADRELQEPPEQDIMALFEDVNEADDDKALSSALSLIKGFEWQPTKISFYFNQLETKMTTAGVKKNWTKFQVLTTILPTSVQDELISTLQKSETDFPNNDAYKVLKHKILKIFGQSEETRFERALQRTLTGKPSQLARVLVNDICDHELDGCCCRRAVATLWKQKIPLAVRQSVAHFDFNKDNFDTILSVADSVFQSSQPSGVTVAAVSVQPPSWKTAGSEQELQNQAFIADPNDPIQVATQNILAAVQRGGFTRRNGGRSRGGRGRGQGRGRGGRGSGNSGGSGTSGGRWSNLQRHPDNPPSSVCKKHYLFGKSAHWCEEPASCPWKDYFVPKNK